MVIFLDFLLVVGAIVLALGMVASASKNRRQRKTSGWPIRGIWFYPQRPD